MVRRRLHLAPRPEAGRLIPTPPMASVESFHDAPELPVKISTAGACSQFVALRRASLREHVEWWREPGHAWWVVAAEIAGFEAGARAEEGPRR